MSTQAIPLPAQLPISGAASTNPIDEEIKRAHGSLTPEAQQAVSMAIGGNNPSQPAASPTAAIPSPMGAPSVPTPSISPIPTQSAGQAPAGPMAPIHSPIPEPPGMTAAKSDFQRLTAPPMQTGPLAHTKADTGRTGVDQIHSPIARIPLQILDAIGSGIFPGIAMGIPGTSAHHALLVHNAAATENQQEEQQNNAVKRGQEEAVTGHTEAQTGAIPADTALKAAQTGEANARTKEIAVPSAAKTIETSDGIMQWDPETKAYDITAGESPKGDQQNVHILPSGEVVAIHHDPKTGKSTAEVLYKGDPKVATEVKQIEVGGKPHQVLINSQTGETVKDLGETGEKPPVINVNAANSERDREAARFAKPHEKALADSSAQLDKIADARSMVNGNAESQALGMPKVLTALVSGQGSGVRITQPELNAIAKARGLAGDVEGTLRGWAGKGKLTPQQQQQLTSILDDVKSRIQQKQSIANDALDKINAAPSREEIARIDKEARKQLVDMEKGGAATSGGSDGHVIELNGKQYKYNGTGATDDMKSYTEVKPNGR